MDDTQLIKTHHTSQTIINQSLTHREQTQSDLELHSLCANQHCCTTAK